MESQPLGNLLLQEVQCKIDETPLGTWRRFMYPNGSIFEEYVSHSRFFGLPFLHYTHGKCPETGRRVVAKGIIAIGRLAAGVIAVGQASFGVVAIGQLALGKYVLAQIGVGQHVWDMRGMAPVAREFFRPLIP